ncbi:Guadeloupe Resistance Complex single-pass transmembrane protein 1 [Biomphalaria pfeifferi]|uniref:Guadeloupe Resistance Complex single-pass transmembrane protein 1 n=1 Tax=Biomphalaria pfeifferi TaxID=112525 RepID=A0AAD8B8V1_BIOPF|nr:Guadeloupe Resistance Complex single-pass transmembrane protein 1 [Biomphalaria pfeifferi]
MLTVAGVIVWSMFFYSTLQHSRPLVQLDQDCPEFVWPDKNPQICSCISIDIGPNAVEPNWYSFDGRLVPQSKENNVSAKLFLTFNVSDPYPVYYCSEKSKPGPDDIKYTPKFVYASGEVNLSVRSDRVAFDSPRPKIEVNLCPEPSLYILCNISVQQFFTWTTGFLSINNITLVNVTSWEAASRYTLFHQFRPTSSGKFIVSCNLRNQTQNDQHQVVCKYNIIVNGDLCNIGDSSCILCLAVSTTVTLLCIVYIVYTKVTCLPRINIRNICRGYSSSLNIQTASINSLQSDYRVIEDSRSSLADSVINESWKFTDENHTVPWSSYQ